MNYPPDRGGPAPSLGISFDKSRKLTIFSPGEKFLVMERVNSADNLTNVSPFLIKKVIDNAAAGEVLQCKKLLNGSILIQTKSLVQASNLIQLSSLSPDIQVELKEHPGLNYAKGVIYSNDLRGIDESEILVELKKQNVAAVSKIRRKEIDGSLKETGLIIITFASTHLPNDLAIGYEKVRVRPYIPSPLKCKNCHQYGHIAKICKNEKICANCSNTFHTNPELNETCKLPAACINCKNCNIENTNHPTNDKNCPIFLKEKEIQAISTLEKVGKKKAASIYRQRHSHPNVSYSSITKNVTSSSFVMPPLMDTNSTRFSKDYSELASDMDNSISEMEMETDQPSSSSQTAKGKKPIILPKNTPKRLIGKIKTATRKSERISK